MAEYPGLELFQEDRCLLVTLSLSGSRPNLDEAAVRTHVVDAGYAGWALFDEAIAQLLAAWHHGGGIFARNLQRCHASLACPDACVWRENRASRGCLSCSG